MFNVKIKKPYSKKLINLFDLKRQDNLFCFREFKVQNDVVVVGGSIAVS